MVKHIDSGGVEPTRFTPSELASDALNHSATLSVITAFMSAFKLVVNKSLLNFLSAKLQRRVREVDFSRICNLQKIDAFLQLCYF